MSRLHAYAAVLSVAGLLGYVEPAASHTYSLTEIGTLPSNSVLGSKGTAINNTGSVTGFAELPGGGHAFVYQNGALTDIGTLGGRFSYGFGINALGQITGYSTVAGDLTSFAFIYSNNVMRSIGTLGGNSSFGNAINDAGQVTGAADTVNGISHAFIYSSGVMTDLGTLGGQGSTGFSINNAGQVVGTSDVIGQSHVHAFLYSNGVMSDIGTLGGTQGNAFGINSSGQIVGQSSLAGDQTHHAFLFQNGAMEDLGTLPGGDSSVANGINSQGEIVGSSHDFATSPQDQAFVYRHGVMLNLNDLIDAGSPLKGFVALSEGTAINDNGWIVAYGVDSRTEQYRAYLLVPNTVEDRLAALLKEVTGVGPGKSLANKVALAQTYYASNDVQATCAILTDFVSEVEAQRDKKISSEMAGKLIADAQAIMAAIGCD